MKRLIHFVFIVVATIAFSACNHAKVYDEYAHTPIAGWEKNDTLSFEVSPPWKPPAITGRAWGLRITGANPFMALHSSLNQTIYH